MKPEMKPETSILASFHKFAEIIIYITTAHINMKIHQNPIKFLLIVKFLLM